MLEARDLETSVTRAEAGREEVKSAIPEADSTVALASAQLDLAQVTFHRMQDLLSKRSIADQEYAEASARSGRGQHGARSLYVLVRQWSCVRCRLKRPSGFPQRGGLR